MDAKTIKKRISTAYNACIWLLGIQAFGSAYYLLTGIANRNDIDIFIGLLCFGIGALFYWIYKKTKNDESYKNFGSMFLLCLGLDAIDIGVFLSEGDFLVLITALAIRLPICILLYKGTIASIEQYKKS